MVISEQKWPSPFILNEAMQPGWVLAQYVCEMAQWPSKSTRLLEREVAKIKMKHMWRCASTTLYNSNNMNMCGLPGAEKHAHTGYSTEAISNRTLSEAKKMDRVWYCRRIALERLSCIYLHAHRPTDYCCVFVGASEPVTLNANRFASAKLSFLFRCWSDLFAWFNPPHCYYTRCVSVCHTYLHVCCVVASYCGLC